MIIDEKEYEIAEEYDVIEDNKSNLQIKLNGINNVIDISFMFDECCSLASLADIQKWNTGKITNMSHMFNKCYLLSSLPDISKWNTNNVTNMSHMFNGCNSLKTLPEISK